MQRTGLCHIGRSSRVHEFSCPVLHAVRLAPKSLIVASYQANAVFKRWCAATPPGHFPKKLPFTMGLAIDPCRCFSRLSLRAATCSRGECNPHIALTVTCHKVTETLEYAVCTEYKVSEDSEMTEPQNTSDAGAVIEANSLAVHLEFLFPVFCTGSVALGHRWR